MTLFRAANTLKAARHHVPDTRRKCACCGDTLHLSDFPAPGDFTHETALLDRYGTMPCSECANDHDTCIHCGAVQPSEDLATHFDGPVCLGCVDDYEAEALDEWALRRTLRRMTR
nr:hypothetical protein [uncultured Roseovarius sp.]